MTVVNKIDAKQAKDWLDNQEAVLIDVREPGEYAALHIDNATLAPVGTINISQLPEHTNKKVIIHCKMGVRGGKACEILLAENPELDVYNLEGGILAWMDAGLPVVRS